LDVGTGSGILSLVALTLGAKSARGIDIDSDSIGVARENATRNGLETRASFDRAILATLSETYDHIVANIEAPTLCELRNDLMRVLRPGGLLILSGILATQGEAILSAFNSLQLVSVFSKGEWIAPILRGDADPKCLI